MFPVAIIKCVSKDDVKVKEVNTSCGIFYHLKSSFLFVCLFVCFCPVLTSILMPFLEELWVSRLAVAERVVLLLGVTEWE